MANGSPEPHGTAQLAMSTGAKRTQAGAGAVLAILLVAYVYAVVSAPIDSVQGVIQKILYVHPPLAYGAYLGFIVTACCGALYLWRNDEQWDRLAIAGAEVGILFCTLMLVTGPIWARGTWGKWWSWDPRLTVTLLLWFVYLAYLLLRSFSDGGSRTARMAAVYGLIGAVLIPLNYFVIEIFGGRGMHPENLERGSLGDGMGMPFLIGNLTLLMAFVYLLLLRWEVETLRTGAARIEAAAVSETHAIEDYAP
jgi:heme exporter protein C